MSTCYPPAPSVSMINDRNGGGRAKKRPINSSSRLLDAQENQFLFSLFGQDNVSLSSAVVELLCSENRQWRRKNQGVVCLIKDYRNRAYFLRIYDLIVGKQIWDFNLYKGFKADVLQGCNQLLVFQGENDNQVFGLNFSSTDEAFEFKKHLDKRREQESRSVSQRNRGPPAHSLSIPANSTPIGGNQMIRTGPSPMGMVGGVTPVGTMAAHSGKTPATSGGGLFSRGKGKKDKDKKRIRKEDISNPTNFQHKAHVGWDQDNGFSNNVYDSEPMDESIKNIIRAAGQDPTNMTKKDIKFVYDFLENYSEETPVAPPPKPAPVSSHPPPVPISQPISQWGQPPPAPPPPPSRGASHGGSVVPPSRPPPPPPNGGGRAGGARPLPQVPSSQPSDGHRPQQVPPPPPPAPPPMGGVSTVPPAPPPPPPSFVSSSAPPAPPPPPPSLGALPAGLPPPQNGRGNLLAEIQAGKSLRSVGSADNKRSPTSGDTRGDVMAQIRQGAQLKHVDTSAEQEKRRSAQGGGLADMGGIAGALAKALEDRRMNMGIDESSDEDEDSDEKNEWSD